MKNLSKEKVNKMLHNNYPIRVFDGKIPSVKPQSIRNYPLVKSFIELSNLEGKEIYLNSKTTEYEAFGKVGGAVIYNQTFDSPHKAGFPLIPEAYKRGIEVTNVVNNSDTPALENRILITDQAFEEYEIRVVPKKVKK